MVAIIMKIVLYICHSTLYRVLVYNSIYNQTPTNACMHNKYNYNPSVNRLYSSIMASPSPVTG